MSDIIQEEDVPTEEEPMFEDFDIWADEDIPEESNFDEDELEIETD